MKRAFQIAGILLILLIGAGPALAAVGCVLSSSAMGPSCPMGMTEMAADCPMAHTFAATDCSQDCCNRSAPIAQVADAVPVKPKFVAVALHFAGLTVSAAPERNARHEVVPRFAASSPPRYILLQVFRI
jgi:hypothetical protein